MNLPTFKNFQLNTVKNSVEIFINVYKMKTCLADTTKVKRCVASQAYGKYDIYLSEGCIRSHGMEWPASAAEVKQYGKSRALLVLIQKICTGVSIMMHNL